jgi:hypothetical protein
MGPYYIWLAWVKIEIQNSMHSFYWMHNDFCTINKIFYNPKSKPGVVAYSCNPNIRDIEAGRWEI